MKVAALVLAGGAGQRFGGAKLLAPLAGRALIDHALDAAAAAADEITVVVGHDPAVADHARGWARANQRPVRIVVVSDPAEGMGASLRTGLASLDPDTDGAFVYLGDMPCLPPGIAEPLARALAAGAGAAAPRCAGRRGHPVLLGRELIARHPRIAGDRGAAALLADAANFVTVETSDDGVLFDVDTEADLAEAERRLSGES